MKKILLAAVLVAACGWGCTGVGGGKYEASEDLAMMESADDAPVEIPVAGAGEEATRRTVDAPTEELTRKIIREGDIKFRSRDVARTRRVIDSAVGECRGYISADRDDTYDSQTQHHVTIRVPAANFDVLLARISGDVEKFDSKIITARDVTEEYIDVEARIKTKKELAARYTDLLRRAQKMDDILTVERQIASLQGEIESMEGRLRFLQNQVAYSTLDVTFYDYREIKTGFGFGDKLLDGFSSGWHVLLWICIGVAHLWPFLLAAIALVVWLRWLVKRGRKNLKP